MVLSSLIYHHLVRPLYARVVVAWLRRDMVIALCGQCGNVSRATVMREAFLVEDEREAWLCPDCLGQLEEVVED